MVIRSPWVDPLGLFVRRGYGKPIKEAFPGSCGFFHARSACDFVYQNQFLALSPSGNGF